MDYQNRAFILRYAVTLSFTYFLSVLLEFSLDCGVPVILDIVI